MTPAGPEGVAAKRRQRRLATEIKESLRELSVQLSMLNHQISAHAELQPADIACLYLINRHGSLSPTALARSAGLHPATVTGILDRLEGGGWISRERNPADRRAVALHPLRDRNAELFGLYSGMNASVEMICTDYDEDQQELLIDFLHRATSAGRTASDDLAGLG